MLCLTSARMNMTAKVLRQFVDDGESTGHYEVYQDPESGAIIRKWVEKDPDNPDAEEMIIACAARPIVNSGMKGAGTTEEWGERYVDVDWIKMSFPAHIILSKRDRITDIKSSKGVIVWKEEEIGEAVATVFDIVGISPVTDPFGNHIENLALLRRAEVQDGD